MTHAVHHRPEGREATTPRVPGKYLSLTSFRRDPRVTIAPCTATGRLHGTPVPAWAKLLPDAELVPTERLMAAKYRIDLLFIKPLRTLQAAPRPPRWHPQAIRRCLVVRERASSSPQWRARSRSPASSGPVVPST